MVINGVNLQVGALPWTSKNFKPTDDQGLPPAWTAEGRLPPPHCPPAAAARVHGTLSQGDRGRGASAGRQVAAEVGGQELRDDRGIYYYIGG